MSLSVCGYYVKWKTPDCYFVIDSAVKIYSVNENLDPKVNFQVINAH